MTQELTGAARETLDAAFDAIDEAAEAKRDREAEAVAQDAKNQKHAAEQLAAVQTALVRIEAYLKKKGVDCTVAPGMGPNGIIQVDLKWGRRERSFGKVADQNVVRFQARNDGSIVVFFAPALQPLSELPNTPVPMTEQWVEKAVADIVSKHLPKHWTSASPSTP